MKMLTESEVEFDNINRNWDWVMGFFWLDLNNVLYASPDFMHAGGILVKIISKAIRFAFPT